ncbi:MAG: lysophospholipid acyltransferase family protein [Candidatus Nanopelagicales bacterium]
MVNPSQAARAAGDTGPRAWSTSASSHIPQREDVDSFQHIFEVLQSALTSARAVDEFGFDPELTDTILIPVLRPLYRAWFRVSTAGLGNIPASGSGLVVSNHAGAIAVDALMTQVAIHDEHPAHRHLRSLTADLVFRLPVLNELASRAGLVRAKVPNAEGLLTRGELVGVWPEGFKGIGKPFHKRYQLQRFGRGGFVAVALRTGAPLIPTAIVGSEEIYPIIGDARRLAKIFDLPYFPITPTFPLLGPMGMIPLPSKWTIEFGEPIATAQFGPEAAEDPEIVFALADQVRDRIQQMLIAMLMHRTSVFD